MATRIKQEYSGSADDVNVKTNYPNYLFEAEIPFNSEININVPPDVYRRLQQQLAYLDLVNQMKAQQ